MLRHSIESSSDSFTYDWSTVTFIFFFFFFFFFFFVNSITLSQWSDQHLSFKRKFWASSNQFHTLRQLDVLSSWSNQHFLFRFFLRFLFRFLFLSLLRQFDSFEFMIKSASSSESSERHQINFITRRKISSINNKADQSYLSEATLHCWIEKLRSIKFHWEWV